MRALLLFVYRHGADCTNGGISSRTDRILVACEDGSEEIDETKPLPENLFRIENTGWGDKPHLALVPFAKVKPGNVGWMMGGNFAYSSDSRFSKLSQYPLGIHDRQETEDEYRLLSV